MLCSFQCLARIVYIMFHSENIRR